MRPGCRRHRPLRSKGIGGPRPGARRRDCRPRGERLEGRWLLSFVSSGNFAVGAAPRSVAVGDVNGDGRSDLAVANDNVGSVSVLLGNGDGTFKAARNFAA